MESIYEEMYDKVRIENFKLKDLVSKLKEQVKRINKRVRESRDKVSRFRYTTGK